MDNLVVTMQKTDLENLIISCVNECLANHKQDKEEFSEFPEFLTRKQATELLGISLGTLDSWTKQGRIERHRNGKVIRYRKADLLQSFKTSRKYERALP